MKYKMETTIVLTTYNKQRSLEKTLTSLENQHQMNFEVNIMDDGSNDETPSFCKDYVMTSPFPCKYVRLDKPGYNLPILRNLGIEFSSGQFLIFLDDDIIVTPQFVEEYQSHFHENPESVHLGKLLYVKSAHIERLSIEDIKRGDFDKLRQGLLSELDPRKGVLKDLELFYKVWGGNLGLSRIILSRLNGFDEDFESWGGLDSDLGLRLVRAGYPISLSDDCLGYHLGTEFKSMDEIDRQPGVRMFKDIKMKDPTIRRNTMYKNKGNYPITIHFNGNRFKKNL
jgi:glycosyltransferase involved in cell wall biosynthesis